MSGHLHLGWLALFYAMYFAFVGLYSPFFGPYLKSIGYSLDFIALVLAMMQLTRVVGPFAWGWLADQKGSRVLWIQFGALAGFLFAVLAFFHQKTASYLLTYLLFLNLSISGLVPISDSFAMERCAGCPGQYGKIRLCGSLGFIFAVLGFGAVANQFGFASYPVWICAVLLLCFSATLMFTPKTHFVDSYGPISAVADGVCFKHLLLQRSMPLFWLAAFFMILAHGIFYAYFSLYLLEFNYSEWSIGGLWAFGVICEVIFFALQAYFFKMLSLNAWLCVGFAACALRFSLVAAFPDVGLVMVISQGLHAFTFAAHHTATISWLRENLPSRWLVRGQALYATIAYGLGGAAGAFLGHFSWDWLGPTGVFGMAALSGLIALIFGLFFAAKNNKLSAKFL